MSRDCGSCGCGLVYYCPNCDKDYLSEIDNHLEQIVAIIGDTSCLEESHKADLDAIDEINTKLKDLIRELRNE